MKTLRIAHLYTKLLNIYGDIGNVLALKCRAEWRNIPVEIDEINIGSEIKEHDIYFIGGGQDLQQIEVSAELQKHKNRCDSRLRYRNRRKRFQIKLRIRSYL